MVSQSKDEIFDPHARDAFNVRGSDYVLPSLGEDDITAFQKIDLFKEYQWTRLPVLYDLLVKLAAPAGKKSFLVFKHNKYITVPTESIAYFYVKHESCRIKCFDGREYVVNHPLDHVQNLLGGRQFFRLNRQYLVNFSAVKEVEHYFARKLLVQLVIPMDEKLLVTKEKATVFLNWLESR